MLPDEQRKIAGLGEAQVADAVELMLDRLDEPPAPLFVDALAERVVECLVELQEPFEILISCGSALRLQQIVQSAEHLGATIRRGFTHDGDLERFADEARLKDFVQADGRYEAAALWQDFHQAVLGELYQCLTDRCAADAELEREFGFGVFLPRPQAHGDDRAAQDFADLRGYGLTKVDRGTTRWMAHHRML